MEEGWWGERGLEEMDIEEVGGVRSVWKEKGLEDRGIGRGGISGRDSSTNSD